MRGSTPKYRTLYDVMANTAPRNGCLEWQGKRDPLGYGRMLIGRTTVSVTRLVLSLVGLEEISGGIVMHTCDNPPCIKPSHLVLGTKKKNSDDMVAKGRARYVSGEQHGSAVLTAAQVMSIRRLRGVISQRSLARKLGCSRSAVCHAQSGKNWKFIPEGSK